MSGCRHLPKPQCVSPCGTAVFNTTDCAGYAAREKIALDVLSTYAKVDPVGLCRKLDAYHVMMAPGEYFIGYGGEKVAGETWCDFKAIYLATMTWKTGALVHEIGHVAEDCNDPLHTQWNNNGIYKAIQKGHEQ